MKKLISLMMLINISYTINFNINIDSKGQECFYEDLYKDLYISFESSVINNLNKNDLREYV